MPNHWKLYSIFRCYFHIGNWKSVLFTASESARPILMGCKPLEIVFHIPVYFLLSKVENYISHYLPKSTINSIGCQTTGSVPYFGAIPCYRRWKFMFHVLQSLRCRWCQTTLNCIPYLGVISLLSKVEIYVSRTLESNDNFDRCRTTGNCIPYFGAISLLSEVENYVSRTLESPINLIGCQTTGNCIPYFGAISLLSKVENYISRTSIYMII